MEIFEEFWCNHIVDLSVQRWRRLCSYCRKQNQWVFPRIWPTQLDSWRGLYLQKQHDECSMCIRIKLPFRSIKVWLCAWYYPINFNSYIFTLLNLKGLTQFIKILYAYPPFYQVLLVDGNSEWYYELWSALSSTELTTRYF